jgi:hypothetical protein
MGKDGQEVARGEGAGAGREGPRGKGRATGDVCVCVMDVPVDMKEATVDSRVCWSLPESTALPERLPDGRPAAALPSLYQ